LKKAVSRFSFYGLQLDLTGVDMPYQTEKGPGPGTDKKICFFLWIRNRKSVMGMGA
jgi:hypothetical protein